MNVGTLRWRVGDGHIRLTLEEACWLLCQPGTPALVWAEDSDAR